jgi:hypothetical protein
MPAEVKEKQQMDRMEQSLSGVSARFDELTARFESSINSLNDVLRTHAADLNAHNDQYISRFAQIERAFDTTQVMLNQQSARLTALEQTAAWVSSIIATVTMPTSSVSGGATRSTGGAASTSTGAATAAVALRRRSAARDMSRASRRRVVRTPARGPARVPRIPRR